MSLVQNINVDLKEALKARDSFKTETIRIILAAVQNKEIEKRGKGDEQLSDEDVVGILRKESKKRKEAIEVYGKAGRKDLEEKESKELEIIKGYLPPEMPSGEIEIIIKKVITEGESNFGAVMKAVMKEVAGKAEAGLVSELVKKNLG